MAGPGFMKAGHINGLINVNIVFVKQKRRTHLLQFDIFILGLELSYVCFDEFALLNLTFMADFIYLT